MIHRVWSFVCLVALLSTAAAAQVTLTGGRVAKFKDTHPGSGAQSAVIKFAQEIQLFNVANPTCDAAVTSELHVSTSAQGGAVIDLPCAYWAPAGSGYRYRDKAASAGGVQQIVYKPGKLSIALKGQNYAPIVGPVSSIDVNFRVGPKSYCARFTVFRHNQPDNLFARGPSGACIPTDPTPTPTAAMAPTPTRTPPAVPICGDGVVQGAEQCDDGNTTEGDCCTAGCVFEAAGSACTDDGNPCTNDACNGAGLCQHINNTAPCDDGSRCTQNDHCSGGVCGGDFLAPWINEINYDGYDVLQPLKDHEEFVELAAPAGVNLGGYRLLAVEGAGSGSFLQPCATGNLSAGQAYFNATIPAGTVVRDDTGVGTGLLVLCFDHTSGDIEDDGRCDVVLTGMPSSDSNLPDGALSNLWDCADGVLLLDPSGNLVDAVSYEGHVANAGPYGAYFVGAPNAGRDWGLVTEPRRSLAKKSDTLHRETDDSQWIYTSDSPGTLNAGQSLSCYSDPGYTNTNYPIVLAHGLLGFDSVFGVFDYWYGIVEALQAGGATVFVAQVSQLNTPQARGDQLITQIEQIVAITGKPKVNLIGHSQGGLDARYVAAVRPDLVASVTSVAGPHKGAELADFLRDNIQNGSFTEQALALFADSLGDIIALLSGSRNPNDALPAIESLTSASVAQFNALYPQGVPTSACGEGAAVANGIYYFSWSGTGLTTTGIDDSDNVLALTAQVYSEPSDGLVGRCSSHLGHVIRDDYFHNHLDEVNQLLGLVPLFEANPKSIFRAHANRLKNLHL